ncbi:MAG: tRNA lysidine(34) synthetase TilS, partial [Bacilli bacterium]|nr:tRNA lysidine(34) synthetase TilS [Bacilli bacterium]
KIDKFLQKEILYYIMSEFYQDDLILISDKHIELLLDLIYSNRANVFVNLPNEVVATKNYDYLELKRVSDEITSYEIEFDNYVELPNNKTIKLITETVSNSNNICKLNSEEITLPLIIRTRKIGDKMYVKGLNGSKKIKDIFINSKINTKDRDMWPVVVDSKGIVVWLPGLKKSKYDKKKDEKYDIILEYS